MKESEGGHKITIPNALKWKYYILVVFYFLFFFLLQNNDIDYFCNYYSILQSVFFGRNGIMKEKKKFMFIYTILADRSNIILLLCVKRYRIYYTKR